jgi:hypothetical protein
VNREWTPFKCNSYENLRTYTLQQSYFFIIKINIWQGYSLLKLDSYRYIFMEPILSLYIIHHVVFRNTQAALVALAATTEKTQKEIAFNKDSADM